MRNAQAFVMEPLFVVRKCNSHASHLQQFEGKPRSIKRRDRARAQAATLAELDRRGLVTHPLHKTACNRQGSSQMGSIIGADRWCVRQRRPEVGIWACSAATTSSVGGMVWDLELGPCFSLFNLIVPSVEP